MNPRASGGTRMLMRRLPRANSILRREGAAGLSGTARASILRVHRLCEIRRRVDVHALTSDGHHHQPPPVWLPRRRMCMVVFSRHGLIRDAHDLGAATLAAVDSLERRGGARAEEMIE